jgi:putative membrane protein
MDFATILQSLSAGFPYLVLHFSITVAIWVAGVALYMASTPYRELKLIRENNHAAAISLGGAMIGLAVPLAFAMAASVSAADILVWGALTIAIQVIVYRAIDLLMRGMPARIEAGEIAPAVLMVSAKLSVAAFNAAAVSG